jgi:DNA-binding transcriptional LysR family regulator
MAKRGGRGEVGQLRVGFTGSTAFNEIVPRALRDFRHAYPEVAVTLEELNTPSLLDHLGRQQLDAIFIRHSRNNPPGLAVLSLCEESMVALLPSGHRLADRHAITLKELAGEPMVFPARAVGPALYDEVIDACGRAGFEPFFGQVAPQMTSIANLVAVELGVSIVPSRLAIVAVPGVVFLPIAGDVPVARLALATRLDDRSVITRNFIATVKKALGNARETRTAEPVRSREHREGASQ